MSYQRLAAVTLAVALCFTQGRSQTMDDLSGSGDTSGATVKQWAIAYGSGSLSGLIVPNTSGSGYYLSAIQPNSYKGQDTIFAALDASGGVTWAKEIDWSTSEKDSFTVKPLSDGFLVTGVAQSSKTPNQNQLIWAKFDQNWKQVYANSFSGSGIITTGSFNSTSDGGLLFTGTLVIDAGTVLTCANTIIFKLNSAGTMLWKNVLEYSCVDVAGPMVEVKDGYIVAGVMGDPVTKIPAVFLMKHSKTGAGILWTKRYAVNFGAGSITLNFPGVVSALKQLSDGNLLIVGTTHEMNPALGGNDALLMKVEPSGGGILWQNLYGSKSVSVGSQNVIENSDKSLLVSGSAADLKTNNFSIVAFKVTSSGAVGTQVRIGSSSDNNLGLVMATKSGSFYLTGWHSKSLADTGTQAIWGTVNSTKLTPTWLKTFSGSSGIEVALATTTGFFVTGGTTTYGPNAAKGNVFGMVLDSSGNYANCHVSPLTLTVTNPGITWTPAALVVDTPQLKALTEGKVAGTTLPVTKATLKSTVICPAIMAQLAGDDPDDSLIPGASCDQEAADPSEPER